MLVSVFGVSQQMDVKICRLVARTERRRDGCWFCVICALSRTCSVWCCCWCCAGWSAVTAAGPLGLIACVGRSEILSTKRGLLCVLSVRRKCELRVPPVRMSSNRRPKVERNPEEGPDQDEDQDVQMEKARVKEALSCRSCDEVKSRPRLPPHCFPFSIWCCRSPKA